MALFAPSESPAVVVKEIDLTGGVPNVQSTTGAMTGNFRWGPVLQRQNIAKRYLLEIKNKKLRLPFYDNSQNHVFHVFIVRVEDRHAFTTYLDTHSVGWLIHYPIPPHQQKALQEFNQLSFPITENIHRTVVSIPMSPVLTEEEVTHIIYVLNRY